MISLTSEQQELLRKKIRDLAKQKEPLSTETEPKLNLLPGIKVVLFDVYGTILISGAEPMERSSEQKQQQAFEETLKAFEIDFRQSVPQKGIKKLHHIIQEVHKQKKKQGIDYPEVDIIAVYRRLFEWLNMQELVGDYQENKIPDMVTDFVTRYDEPSLMPGLQDIMNWLCSKKITTGIISNSQFYTPITLEALTGKTLQEIGFDKELLFWSFSEDIAKPSVRFYDIAAQKLSEDYSIKPEEVLFVGNDMLNDVYPAQQTGFKTALFAGDQRSLRLRKDNKSCKKTTPDVILTHLSQIKEIFSGEK